MSFSEKEARLERVYASLSTEEKKIVDNWDGGWDEDDKKAFWSNLSPSARRYLYIRYDASPLS
jgi:hypothetical protein